MLAPFVLLAASPGRDLRAIAARNADAFRQAVVRRDGPWFERTFAPDFVQRMDVGHLDRRTALAQLRAGLLRMQTHDLTVKVVAVRAEGKGYVATVAWRGTTPAIIENRPARLTATWRDDQRWAPANGRWVLRGLTTSRFERTIQ